MSTFANRVDEFIEMIKNFWKNFDLKTWSKEVGGTSAEAIEAAIQFGVFFGLGFLFKKYFKFLFINLILFVIFFKIMEINNFIKIDWVVIENMTGIGPTLDLNTLASDIFMWIKDHVVLFVASCIGLLVGYKLG